eukprot:CAMPEP_0177588484 /NCGR_PEP_ID=MMETSP0419_2-20121207/6249_1 /TAXON_ID=582737 /ORGANISM="Tetraselmis sp., Strain GSL018" /LENGTH=118 /DNA_ID=CAMNT_0019078683 /DNA_START=256 /DNA_END=609 /DNA_ORIENTATION=-
MTGQKTPESMQASLKEMNSALLRRMQQKQRAQWQAAMRLKSLESDRNQFMRKLRDAGIIKHDHLDTGEEVYAALDDWRRAELERRDEEICALKAEVSHLQNQLESTQGELMDVKGTFS